MLAVRCSVLVDLSGLSGGAMPSEAGGPVETGPSLQPYAEAEGATPALDAACSADLATDAKNCGACGRACAGSCVGGLCDAVIVATGISQGGCLLVDGAFVEWSSGKMLSWKAKAGGPTASTLVADDFEAAGIVDCLNDSVETYVAFNGSVDSVPLRAPMAGFTRVVYARDNIRRIALGAAQHLFWIRSEGAVEGCAKGNAACINNTSSITGLPPHDLRGVVADDQRVYWTSYDDGKILALPLGAPAAFGPTPPDGGYATPTEVSASAGKPTALLKSGDDVVWADDGGRILRARADGSAAAVVLASGQASPVAIAADAVNVYWATASGRLWRVPLAGGQPLVLANGAAARITVDDTDLYWLERNASGNIYRVTK